MATHGEARRKGRLPGYAVRLDSKQGLVLYLADYRRGGHVATPYPALAEWFEWARDAKEMAARVTRYTGQRWLATVIPADCRPTSADSPLDAADAIHNAMVEAWGDSLDDEDASDVAVSLAYPGGRFRMPVPDVP